MPVTIVATSRADDRNEAPRFEIVEFISRRKVCCLACERTCAFPNDIYCRYVDVRFGSLAAPQHDISLTAASGRKADPENAGIAKF